MNCYEHTNNSAKGLCKSCSKAVCEECIIEFDYGIVCSEKCRMYAVETEEVVERSKKIYGIGKYKSNKLATGVWVWLLFSLGMWAMTIYDYFNDEVFNFMLLIMPVMFTVIAVLAYKSSKDTGIQC